MTNFASNHEFVVQKKLRYPVSEYWENGHQFFDDLVNK